ncbi:unnamed protein product, partial [Prunus brigantina]
MFTVTMHHGGRFKCKEIEIYLEHLDCDIEDFLKCKESQSNFTVETLKNKAGVDTRVESGCETGIETGNEEALVRERRRIRKRKAVVIEPSNWSDSSDGYPSNDSGLVDTRYVMHENDDIDLNILIGDDWQDGISFTNTQGQVAREFVSEARTEATNGPKQGEHDQGVNGHPEGGPGPKEDGNRTKNNAIRYEQGRTGHEGFFFCNDFKPLEDMEECDHINAELWAASNGEEGGLTKRFTKYNHETDNHDPQFE